MNNVPKPPKPPSTLPTDPFLETPKPLIRATEPTPVQLGNESKDLSPGEVTAILRTTLRPEYAQDPSVLKFITAYLSCRSISQAAREANIKESVARYMRGQSDVHECIRQLTEKAVLKYGFDSHDLVERVKEIVFWDPSDLYKPDGSFKHIKDMKPETQRAIKKFKVKNLFGADSNGIPTVIGEVIEIELWDRLRSAEMLGRETGNFKETVKVEHDVTGNMRDILLDSRARAEARALESSREVIDVGDKK